ncbi:MAG: hypothetical protein WDO24_07065 [Pseudomonadota bacterium]
MTTRLKEVDAVMVGMGWTGPIVARELTKAGLNVVGLERGPDRDPADEFVIPRLRDELRYALRLELMQNNALDTITFRNASDDQALPIRRFGAFLPGEGVGGTGIHWGALHWRFLPSDFRIRSALTARYGGQGDPGRHDDHGLAGQLCRARAVLRPVRQIMRRVGQGRKSARHRGRRRQPVRGAAQRRIPQPADQDGARADDVRRRRPEPRLSPLPGAGRNRERALYQPRGHDPGRLRILRLLATAPAAKPTRRRRPTSR